MHARRHQCLRSNGVKGERVQPTDDLTFEACGAACVAPSPFTSSSVEDAALTERRHGTARRRVDPRISILVLLIMNVAAFIAANQMMEVASVILDAALMVWLGRGRLALSWLVGYGVLVALSFACMMGGPFFAPVGTCFLTMRKIFPTAMFAAAMISSTYVGEMACALERFGLSGRMTVAVCVALRFFPTAAREAKAVREAMLTRGVRLTPKMIVTRPATLVEGFMVPYIHRISIVADELGDAVMVRAIEAPGGRTCYHEMRLRAIDVVVLGVAIALLAVAVAGRFFG